MHSTLSRSERPVDASLRERKPVQRAQQVQANHPAGVDRRAAKGRRIAGEGGNFRAGIEPQTSTSNH
jgi:hypothetical protein